MKHALSLLSVLLIVSCTAQEMVSTSYGDNLITLSPFNAYGSNDVSDMFVGLGYERYVHKVVSLQLSTGYGIRDGAIQIGLGPKFYPGGHDKTISYGLAPGFLFTHVRSTVYSNSFDPEVQDYNYYRREEDISQFGFMLTNSMNAILSERIYFNLEGGLGVNYVSHWEGKEEYQGGPGLIGHLACHMGYRF